MKIPIVFFILIFNQIVNAQTTFSTAVKLPEQDSMTQFNDGYYVKYLNNYIYSLHRTSRKRISGFPSTMMYFVKCKMNGDTVFVKKVLDDTQRLNIFNSDLVPNNSRSGFTFSFLARNSSNHVNEINNYIVSIDTLGNTIQKTLTIKTDPAYRSTGLFSYILDDSLYGVVRQLGENSDTTYTYLIKWLNDSTYDTIIKKNMNMTSSFYGDFRRLNSVLLVLTELVKNPNSGIHPSGQTNLHFYNNSYNLLFTKQLSGYFNKIDMIVKNDTLNVLATYEYSIQTFDNRLKYSFFKYTLNGDSISRWNSRTYYRDTASFINELLYFNNQFFIGTQKFFKKISNDSIVFIRDMFGISPRNYCIVNDTTIGFTGSHNKMSTIGIMSLSGKIVSVPQYSLIASSINIYPNPSSGKFTISLQSPQNTKLIIYDVLGNVLFQKDYEYTDTIDIALDKTYSGMLFVRLQTDSGVITKTVLMQ